MTDLQPLVAAVKNAQATVIDAMQDLDIAIVALEAHTNPAVPEVPTAEAPARTLTMSSDAQGTYEQFKENGWTDELLVAHGHAHWVEEDVVPEIPAGEKLNAVGLATGFNYDQYIASGWTDQALIDAGYMDAPTPAAPQVQAPVEVPDDWKPEVPPQGEKLNAAGLATGFTYAQYIDSNWTDEALIAKGWMDAPAPAVPTTPESPAAPAAPQAPVTPAPAPAIAAVPVPTSAPAVPVTSTPAPTAAASGVASAPAAEGTAFVRHPGDYEDVWDTEVPFDERIHGMTKTPKGPKINTNGKFAKRRGVTELLFNDVYNGLKAGVASGQFVRKPTSEEQSTGAPAAPQTAAPQAPVTTSAPQAPAEAQPQVVTGGIEALDNSLKDWD